MSRLGGGRTAVKRSVCRGQLLGPAPDERPERQRKAVSRRFAFQVPNRTLREHIGQCSSAAIRYGQCDLACSRPKKNIKGTLMSFDARSLANYILDASERMGAPLTNMALNKVLYFSHGWHLALYSSPLISNTFEAWEHGPVVPIIYHQFKRHKDKPITSRATHIDMDTGEDRISSYEFFSGEHIDHLDRMIAFYAPKSAPLLSYMSHEPGAPWDLARTSPNQVGMKIHNDIIKVFFATKLRSRKPVDGQA